MRYNLASINKGLNDEVKKMCKLIVYHKRWIIKKGDKTVLLGIGTPTDALATAKAYGVIVTEFKDLNKRAA